MLKLRRLNSSQANFRTQLAELLAYDASIDAGVENVVRDILAAVQAQGDTALLEFTAKFDRLELSTAGEMEIPASELHGFLERISAEDHQALEFAARRIESYAQHQKLQSWDYQDEWGNCLGQQVMPLDRVGIYVPGGLAAYPSSVLMNAIPAKVAGVAEIIMVVPTPDGVVNDLVMAAAAIAGVDRVFRVGGAQAVAALAYGTQTIPAVDKIVGPGNAYVAEAKRRVFGKVGIDMIAGPSEVLIITDGSGNPDWVAMDMFAQAEHDEKAQAILISTDKSFLDKIAASIEKLIAAMPRKDIIQRSLQSRGALIQVSGMDEALELANQIAAEHLELAVEEPEKLIPKIRHAGAIFAGHHSAEVLGDYCAGPNHVLPTSGTARFSSPLGVYEFQKRSSIIQCSRQGAKNLAVNAERLARGEGLYAHAESASYRSAD